MNSNTSKFYEFFWWVYHNYRYLIDEYEHKTGKKVW
jgi:hypothetical protein